MASETPAHAPSIEHRLDSYESLFGSEDILTTATADNFAEAQTGTSTCTFTALSSEDMALRASVAPLAWSTQSRRDSQDAMAITTSYHNALDLLLANPLLLGRQQAWEGPGSLFDGGMDHGTLNDGLEMNLTQSQLAQSHFHLPQPDWSSNQDPSLPCSSQAPVPVCFQAEPPRESSQQGGPVFTNRVPELVTSHDEPFDAPFRSIRPPAMSRAVPSQPRLPHDTPTTEERSHDRPGKKPAATFQPDPLKLEEFCRQVGGRTFAVDWIVPTFKYGVSTEALHRVLKRKEIDEMKSPGGFEPYQAYDGFISKISERYECGLCKEGNRTRWKNKKDAPRHLRKFHFGLADVCNDCGKDVFSRAEMKTHRCVRRARDGAQAE